MRTSLTRLALTAIVLLLGGVAFADDEPVRSAEIRIGLPADATGVRVLPGIDTVTVELPAGARMPADFAEASGGMLAGGDAVELPGGRQRLSLSVERGLLAEVRFDRAALVLRVESRAGRAAAAVASASTADEQYRLGPNDRIRITVYDHPDLSTTLTISRDGLITAPLVDEVPASGLTPRELASRLAELLGRDFLVDPKVDVEVEQYESQWVMVAGEVGKAGRVPLRGGTRLKEVLGEALGFSETAGEEILITRRRGESGEVMRVARTEFENGRANPAMEHGDIIEVARAERCYIQGEVRTPGRVRIERGMTLMRVIAMAGGLTDWASRKNVTVMDQEGGRSRVRVFDLNKIERQKVQDPVIEGGEVIVVKKRFL